ncbi:hypothetical protein BD310DRAFT_927594 [Dichomitus squalens]|uniref:Uncharacterized protein n=1 Tax=Dichomitus squalens TaxID=114155 RepID=A0A4Q9PUS2_9APHY|nr:hypothetical protein BD310DRAFT_927594 [Dichomitus squalens]
MSVRLRREATVRSSLCLPPILLPSSVRRVVISSLPSPMLGPSLRECCVTSLHPWVLVLSGSSSPVAPLETILLDS